MKLKTILVNFLNRLRNSPDFKKSLIYLVASTLAYGIVFIQNFSLAYFLSLEFFGKVTLFISLFSTLYVIFTFGMNAVILRFYFDEKYLSDTRKLITHVASIWLALGTALTIIFSIAGWFATGKYLPLDYTSEFIPILLGSFFFSFTEIFPQLFVAKEKPILYAGWLILTRATIFLFLHIAALIFWESSAHFSLTLLLSGGSLFIVGIIAFKIFPLKIPHKYELNEILLYAFPLMIYALGGIGYSHGYRLIISNWLGFKNLAIFSMANQIAMVYYLIASSFITGFYPKVFRELESQKGNPSAITFYLKILLGIGIGLFLLIIPASYLFFTYFKGGSFMEAFYITPILLLGQFIYILYSYCYVLCTYYKKTKILTYAMFAGVSTSLIMVGIVLNDGELWQASVPVVCGIFVQFALSLAMIRWVSARTISQ